MRARRLLEPQIRALVDEIVEGCVALEAGAGDVHDVRTSCRRVRSLLAAYAPLFKRTPARAVDRDLRELMTALGAVRDAEVAHELLASMDPDGRDELDALEAAEMQTRREVWTWLSSVEGRRAIGQLASFADDVPWTRRARRPARKVVARTVAHERHRVQVRAARARHTHLGDEQDRRLHAVRRAVKRANDASARGHLSSTLRHDRRRWRTAQDVLGRHHDLVMLREELRHYEADEGEHLEAVNAEAEAAQTEAMRTVRRLSR